MKRVNLIAKQIAMEARQSSCHAEIYGKQLLEKCTKDTLSMYHLAIEIAE